MNKRRKKKLKSKLNQSKNKSVNDAVDNSKIETIDNNCIKETHIHFTIPKGWSQICISILMLIVTCINTVFQWNLSNAANEISIQQKEVTNNKKI